jgi:L-ribulose-5-phosphate 4-epimerase
MLEAIARMAYFTVGINPHAEALGKTLHDRHYLRKHGQKAYYGQVRTKE